MIEPFPLKTEAVLVEAELVAAPEVEAPVTEPIVADIGPAVVDFLCCTRSGKPSDRPDCC